MRADALVGFADAHGKRQSAFRAVMQAMARPAPFIALVGRSRLCPCRWQQVSCC